MAQDVDHVLMYFAAFKGPQFLCNNPKLLDKYQALKATYPDDLNEDHVLYDRFVEEVRQLIEAPTFIEMFRKWLTGHKIRPTVF